MFARLTLGCLAFFSLINLNVANAEIMIDDFDVGSTMLQFGPGTANSLTTDVSILGGQRVTSLTVRDLAGQEFFGALGFGALLQVAQGGNDQTFGSFTYSGLGGIDMTEGGRNIDFVIGMLASDAASAIVNGFSITVVSGAVTERHSFDILSSAQAPGQARLSFDQFTMADLTSVDSIQLEFDFLNHPGTDIAIYRFFASHAIPEPGSLLVVVGLLSVLPRRRRV